jgi:transposase-like protein
MITGFKSLIEVITYFKDEQTCREFLAHRRWGNGGPVCPHCGTSKKPYVTNRGYKCSDKDCRLKFTFATGTVYEGTKLSLRIWIAAMYLISSHKKGISSIQLSKDLNITQKTAWYLSHRIRSMLGEASRQKLTGPVEIDESFVGGRLENKHEKKRKELESSGRNIKYHPIVSIVQRGGEVRSFSVPDVTSNTIYGIITKNLERKETMITDGFTSYNWVGRQYNHIAVKHNKNRVTYGWKHTNGVEGYFSHFKRMIIGTYHQVSSKHMQGYCNEMDFRFSNRNISDGDRF